MAIDSARGTCQPCEKLPGCLMKRCLCYKKISQCGGVRIIANATGWFEKDVVLLAVKEAPKAIHIAWCWLLRFIELD